MPRRRPSEALVGVSPRREPLSKGRRRARALVWISFGVVLVTRWTLFPPDPEYPLLPKRLDFWREPEPPPRRRYQPADLRPPQSPVPPDLPRIHLEIAARDVKVLQGYSWQGWHGQPQERPEVRATVREGGRVYLDVAVHLKGAAGSFRPFDDKPALTLNFAKHNPQQRFRGYRKLSLNNSVQDPTFLCEAIAREMFEAAGIPAPRAEFATLLINGADKGLYVLTEGYNKDFLRRHFRDVRGNLYDGGFCREITQPLEVNSGDEPDSRAELDRLARAAAQSAPPDRWEALRQVLDVDRFITLVALEVLICHWDGYAINRNNYRLFHDRELDRLVFLPHGLDQVFGWPPGRYPPDGPVLPPMNGLVARALLTTPEGQRQYLERLGTLCTNRFSASQVTDRIRQLAAKIRPTLTAYDPAAVARHDARVSALCGRVVERFRSVAWQLQPVPPAAGPEADPARTAGEPQASAATRPRAP